eukprot:COSAG04_NODE_1050_length_8556_cov_22.381296_5_plen_105_part_00
MRTSKLSSIDRTVHTNRPRKANGEETAHTQSTGDRQLLFRLLSTETHAHRGYRGQGRMVQTNRHPSAPTPAQILNQQQQTRRASCNTAKMGVCRPNPSTRAQLL